MVGRWPVVVAVASILVMHNCEVKSEEFVPDEEDEGALHPMEQVELLMYNKGCAKKVWPVLYKAILTVGAEKTDPEKRLEIVSELAERAMKELDGISDLGCTASSFDALLTASYHMSNDIGNNGAAYNLYTSAAMILKGSEDQYETEKVASLFGAIGALEKTLANSYMAGTQPNPDPQLPWGLLEQQQVAQMNALRDRSAGNLRKALEYQPGNLEYRQLLAQVMFDTEGKRADSKLLYEALLVDKDLMDTNDQFKLYQNLRYFALYEKKLKEAEMYTEEIEANFPWHNGPLVRAYLELARAILSNTDEGQTEGVLKHAERLLRKAVAFSKKRDDSNRSTMNELAAILKRVLLKRAEMDHVLTPYPRPPSMNTTATPSTRRTGGWETGGRDADTVQVGHIDYLNPAEFTNIDDFYTAYLAWNRPVIVGKGLMEEWPAMDEWTKEKLSQPGLRGDVQVITGKTPYPKKMGFDVTKTSVQEFIHNHVNDEAPRGIRLTKEDGHPMYCFQEMQTEEEKAESKKLMGKTPKKDGGGDDDLKTEDLMLQQIAKQGNHDGLVQNWTTIMSDYALPPHFAMPEELRWVSNKVPPPVKHFFVGARGSGSHAHAHQSAFNALLYGRKRWILIPPEYNLANVDEGDMENNAPIQGFLKNVLPQLKEKKIEYIDVIQEPGEFIYVPNLWTHAIYNLEDSVGVAYQIGGPTMEWNYELLANNYPMDFIPKM